MNSLSQGIAALVAKFTAASPAGFQVLDGGVVATDDAFLLVGGSDSDASDDITLSIPLTDHISRVQTFDVTCVVSVWVGDANVAVPRGRALDLFDGYRAALRADPTLGRAVIQARITSAGVNQGVSGEGAVATVTFTVNVTVSTA